MASDGAPANGSSHIRFDEQIEELLALNEDMIEQLRLERLENAGGATILSGIIDEHRKTAAMLRAKVEASGR